MGDQVQETLSRLLTDESQTLKRLVGTAERLLRIDKATGDMVLTVPRLFISDRDFLGLLLLSRYFACKLGLAKRESMTLAEIIQRSGFDEGTVSSRLTELNYNGIVEHNPGGDYSISYSKAEYFLEEAKYNMMVESNKSDLLGEGARSTAALGSEVLRRLGISTEEVFVLTTRRIF